MGTWRYYSVSLFLIFTDSKIVRIEVGTWDLFCLYGLTLMLAWTVNPMSNKVWHEITYPFPNVNNCTVEILEWVNDYIPHFIVDVIT